MKELTLSQIAAWCGADVPEGCGETRITGVESDSRAIAPGNLFIALKGERVDGHDFLGAAAKNGAAAALVEHPVETGLPCLVVPDALLAYGKIAAGYRQLLGLKVIGITGSVGKTTTKEMTACVLQGQFRTARTDGNHNNNLGLPMSILHIPEGTEVAVLEMGMNHFGEMEYLTNIARPDLAVIENAACDVVATDIQELEDGMRFMVSGLGHHFELFVPSAGRHSVYNALAAVTVALLLGMPPEKIQTQLEGFRNTGMRQRIYTQNGMTIIEDCYNAGPESTQAALEVLGNYHTTGRRIAVLGDMLELGNRSSAEHYRIGRIAATKADMLFTYGHHSLRTVTGAITGGMAPKNAEHFDTHEDLAHVLRTRAAEGDVLLFKGSRGMKMEQALHLFLDEEK